MKSSYLTILFLFFIFISPSSYSITDEGRSLFVEKRCVTCHVVGRGVFVGPDLWKVNNKYSKTHMITWISIQTIFMKNTIKNLLIPDIHQCPI